MLWYQEDSNCYMAPRIGLRLSHDSHYRLFSSTVIHSISIQPSRTYMQLPLHRLYTLF